MGGLFSGLTGIISQIGPAIGGLITSVLGTFAAIVVVKAALHTAEKIGGIDTGGGTHGDVFAEEGDWGDRPLSEDMEEEDVIDVDDEEWWPHGRT